MAVIPAPARGAIQAHRRAARRDREAARRAKSRARHHQLVTSANEHDREAAEIHLRLQRAPGAWGAAQGVSFAVRPNALRQQIASHKAAAARNYETARIAPIMATKMLLRKAADRHRARARELGVELARILGSAAPSADAAELMRARRVESLRAAIARAAGLARMARGVGNRSVEAARLAEAQRFRAELEEIERGKRFGTMTRPAAPPASAWLREAPPSRFTLPQRSRLARIDREIDVYLKNAAMHRDRARRAMAAAQTTQAAKALEWAHLMERRAKVSMEARRRLLYAQGRSPLQKRPGAIDETRVGTSAVRAARGPNDVSLITTPAVPSPGYTRPRPGLQPPRPDTVSVRPDAESVRPDGDSFPDPQEAPADGQTDATESPAASVSATPSVDSEGNWTWWLIAGAAVGLGLFAYSRKSKKAPFTFKSTSPLRPAPKPNPRRNRRRATRRRA
ncbi:MAG: hypothetical protein EXR31_10430 [Betaproteobacteria bacterium]|nr:hypothetical protein [Betaproteobacteria bacterium]